MYYAIPFVEIQDGGHLICTMSKFKAFPCWFALENIEDRTKKVLETLIALNTRNLSKILMLYFLSTLRFEQWTFAKKKTLSNTPFFS